MSTTQTAVATLYENELGEISDWTSVKVVNRGTEDVKIQYANRTFIIPANGNELTKFGAIPYHAMVLYCGDPRSFDVPGDMRQRYRTEEYARLRVMYGVYDEVIQNAGNFPKLEIYNMDGERIITVLEDPTGERTTSASAAVFDDDKARLTNQIEQLLEMQRHTQAALDQAVAQINASNGVSANPDAVVDASTIVVDTGEDSDDDDVDVDAPTNGTPGATTAPADKSSSKVSFK